MDVFFNQKRVPLATRHLPHLLTPQNSFAILFESLCANITHFLYKHKVLNVNIAPLFLQDVTLHHGDANHTKLILAV